MAKKSTSAIVAHKRRIQEDENGNSVDNVKCSNKKTSHPEKFCVFQRGPVGHQTCENCGTIRHEETGNLIEGKAAKKLKSSTKA